MIRVRVANRKDAEGEDLHEIFPEGYSFQIIDGHLLIRAKDEPWAFASYAPGGWVSVVKEKTDGPT